MFAEENIFYICRRIEIVMLNTIKNRKQLKRMCDHDRRLLI
ncbi:MAG: hypothetical protein IEMM0006_1777 [bacterium]|nr:MAG: hypothetical protein IEMM0006_1777 [bacterium]